jgi:hypothetical protein
LAFAVLPAAAFAKPGAAGQGKRPDRGEMLHLGRTLRHLAGSGAKGVNPGLNYDYISLTGRLGNF